MYLGAKHFYGSAMSQSLPTNGFEWLNPEEVETLNINSISVDGDKGYVFEVDMKYPVSLHGGHSCYSLAPESFKIEPEMLSSYQQELLSRLDMKAGSTTK